MVVGSQATWRQSVELGRLGKEVNRHTALGNVVVNATIFSNGSFGLLEDNKLLSTIVSKGLLASNKSLRAQVAVRLGEKRQSNGGIARSSIEVDKRDVFLVSGLKRDTIWCSRGTTIGDCRQVLRGGVSVVCAVGVEDAGALDVVGVAQQVQRGANVDRADVGVVDGRLEVLRQVGDVYNEVEALGLDCVGKHGSCLALGDGRRSSGSKEAQQGCGGNHFVG